MHISVPTENGFLDDRYGRRASRQQAPNGPISFPITISDVPAGTKTLAFTLVDFDAIPVGGLPWIHWIGANIPGDVRQLPENASRSGVIDFVQGHNSTAGNVIGETDPEITTRYADPAPPDQDHAYTLTFYALDKELPLKEGFWMNELYHAMADHIIDEAKIDVNYRQID